MPPVSFIALITTFPISVIVHIFIPIPTAVPNPDTDKALPAANLAAYKAAFL